MRDTKDSQFLSDTSNRESLANHLDTETQTWKAVPTCGMDLAMRNVKRGKASEPIDLSDL